MTPLSFKAIPIEINAWTIIRLPADISSMLPSRGMVMVSAVINGLSVALPLEPDGMGSHWFSINDDLGDMLKLEQDQPVSVSISTMEDWIEPDVPEDLALELEQSGMMHHWNRISTKARWEWIRWIRFTHNPETRKKRIKTASSMLHEGKRRPCCFDHSRCTVPEVSRSGQLLVSQ